MTSPCQPAPLIGGFEAQNISTGMRAAQAGKHTLHSISDRGPNKVLIFVTHVSTPFRRLRGNRKDIHSVRKPVSKWEK